MTESTVPLKNRKLAAVLAFLVPGLGHAYQGRWGKALLYFVCINGLFFGGLALGEWKILTWRWVSPLRDPEHFCYWYFCQVLTGLAALPALVQGTLQHYDMSPILWGYGADPGLEAYNGIFKNLGKIVEMGYIYTEAAGLLNVLAIFDAYEGPALRDQAAATASATEPAPPAPVAAPAEAGA